jgi:hypothetical protein
MLLPHAPKPPAFPLPYNSLQMTEDFFFLYRKMMCLVERLVAFHFPVLLGQDVFFKSTLIVQVVLFRHCTTSMEQY